METKTPLEIALKYYGQTAIAGEQTNAVVQEFYRQAGHKEITGDETPWCSAFLIAVMKEAGYPHSDSLLARSWLHTGIEVTEPQLGDVVIFWRIAREGLFGHVGIFISQDAGMVYTLGGNQKNSVCIAPFSKNQLLGYRRLEIK
jgi:uncharacterized protein (TIGR02594 family)